MKTTIAFCDRCHGLWNVPHEVQPETLQGICLECQADSDTEKPLTFGTMLGSDLGLDDLPEGSLACDELTDEEAEAIEEQEDPRGFHEK